MALQKYKMASLKEKYYEEPNRTNYQEKDLKKEPKVEKISKPKVITNNGKKK